MTRAPGYEAIIVGGGVVGSVLAALLIREGLCTPGRVAIVAQRFLVPPLPAADWDLRVYALSRASERLLRLAEVWQRLPQERLHPYERMCVWDAEGEAQGAGAIRFDCAEIGEPNLGWIVDGAILQWQAQAAATAAGAVLLESSLAQLGYEAGQASARLEDGRELRAPILIGADGVNSTVRRLLGIDTAGHSYLQDALVAHVRTAKPHEDSCWQRFLKSGPLAMLPLKDGRSSIVWSTAKHEAQALLKLSAGEFGAALSQASAHILGECELTTPVKSFPLQLQYAQQYVRPGAVLLGDAAHAVHPLAGQGLNLGLMDAAALTQVMKESGAPAQYGDLRILRRYERSRRSENLLAAAGLDGLERLFAAPGPLTAGLRRWGLSAVGRVPVLKRRLAQQALGLSGDVPELLRGPAPL